MGSGGDGDQLPQSSNTLLSTSSRSSLVDHPWLETFFSCPSTPPPPPSSFQTSRPPDTATLRSVFTDAATSKLAPLVVGGVLWAVTLPTLAVPLLGVLGFSSAGVAAYSMAAALQTSQVAAVVVCPMSVRWCTWSGLRANCRGGQQCWCCHRWWARCGS